MRTLVVGAGLAGLSCARELSRNGHEAIVFEASDAPGGRVRTDLVDGFRLDRGFQVLLAEYPECKAALDYDALQLRKFKPGALMWHNGRFHRLVDPRRHPLESILSAVDPFLSVADKLRVGKLVRKVFALTPEQLYEEPESSTIARLQELGFSEQIVERFFRPFFSGVFLEEQLTTSSRLFEFYFQMFAKGATAVPALGMGEIGKQLAQGLDVRCNEPVAYVDAGDKPTVRLESGETVSGDAVVVATNDILRTTAAGDRITLGVEYPNSTQWNGTVCFHYSADHAPLREPILLLNGEGASAGPVNNVAIMSNVSREYAPKGKHLVTVSVVGVYDTDAAWALEPSVRQHLRKWLGTQVTEWKFLRGYNIPHALPHKPHFAPSTTATQPARGVFLAGDVCESGSLNGAIRSGQLAAQAALRSASVARQ